MINFSIEEYRVNDLNREEHVIDATDIEKITDAIVVGSILLMPLLTGLTWAL
jgi:hypothetical protein